MQGDRLPRRKTALLRVFTQEGLMFPGKTFKERVRDNVSTDATLVTDAHLGYAGLDLEFASHETVNHDAGEYKRDIWHTNTIEGFWS